MSKPTTVDLVTMEGLLALVGCQALCSYYGDFNLPPAMVQSPMPLRDGANFTLMHIFAQQGGYFQVLDRANELFSEFLTKLADDYALQSVDQFIDWVRRHRADPDYCGCLLLWSDTLCEFDGYATSDLRNSTVNQRLERAFATYQRLLSLNDKLRRSWTDAKLLSIQDRLETLKALRVKDPFLDLYNSSQQMLSIEELLVIERAYRFLSDLKCICDDAEKSNLIECARQMGADSGWPPSLMAQLTMCIGNHPEQV